MMEYIPRRSFLVALALALPAVAADQKDPPAAAAEKARETAKRAAGWLGEDLPLPLVVKTPQDLAFKERTEREYLEFNLLAGGKLAFDQARWADAAQSLESLLALPDLSREIDDVARPLAIEARKRAGQAPVTLPTPPKPRERIEPRERVEPAAAAASAAVAKKAPARVVVDVAGQITGGGAIGPGGAVVSLRRADGRTPRPAASGEYLVSQVAKRFVPRIVAVPVGATVNFRNDDPIYHNVFSLNEPNDFDLGLYRNGLSRAKTFEKPGALQVFCNIHAAMNAWVVVLDTPWFAVSDATGRFVVRNVPPGEYTVEAWHEASTNLVKATASVAPGLAPLALVVPADRRAAAFPPDKYGKGRQQQLGY